MLTLRQIAGIPIRHGAANPHQRAKAAHGSTHPQRRSKGNNKREGRAPDTSETLEKANARRVRRKENKDPVAPAARTHEKKESTEPESASEVVDLHDTRDDDDYPTQTQGFDKSDSAPAKASTVPTDQTYANQGSIWNDNSCWLDSMLEMLYHGLESDMPAILQSYYRAVLRSQENNEAPIQLDHVYRYLLHRTKLLADYSQVAIADGLVEFRGKLSRMKQDLREVLVVVKEIDDNESANNPVVSASPSCRSWA